MRRRSLLQWILGSATQLCAGRLHATSFSAEGVPPTLVAQVMEQLANAFRTGPVAPRIEVAGEFVMEGELLHTVELFFKAGSKLILAGAYGGSGQKTIIAQKIVIEDVGVRPNIVWQRGSTNRRVPPLAGKASAGESGVDDGSGQNGTNGLSGNRGVSGQSAPNLFILCTEITGGTIDVDLRGMDGGVGGEGQTGGSGGYGRPGDGAISGLYRCANKAASGGNGGNGGKGGRGGTGGRGGNGGSIAVLRPEDHVGLTSQFFNVDLRGGIGGDGGDPGKAGEFGIHGIGGPKSGYCGDEGAPGRDGAPGILGTRGPRGPDGAEGEIREGHLPLMAAAAATLR